MAQPSGLSAQVALTKESTYGTPVTPATFLPFVDEAIDIDRARIESDAILAGRTVLTSAQWSTGNKTVGGDIGFELTDHAFGKVMEQCFGSNATTGSGPYTHTLRPGTLPSATWQIGRPANDGTVYPINLSGAKVASWELGAKTGENVTFGVTLAAQHGTANSRSVSDGATTNSSTTVTSSTAAFTIADEGKTIAGTNIPSGSIISKVGSATSVTISQAATGTGTSITLTIGSALASASYSSSALPMRAGRMSLTIGGSEMYVSECTIKGDNGLAVDRRSIASDYIREPLAAGLREYTADLKCEFDGLTSFQAFEAGTEAAFSFTIPSPQSSSYSVVFSGNCRYDKAASNVGGRDILPKDITVKFVASTSNDYSALQCVIVNGDSSI